MQKKILKKLSVTNIAVQLLVLIAPMLFVEKAEAVGFTQTYVRFDRMASNTVTTGMICAKPSSSLTTYRKLEVTFPDENSATDFVLGIGSTFQNTNISTSNIDGNTAWPDIANATAGVAGNVVTWTHTADQTLSSANTYCFRWLNTTGSAVTTPTTGGASNLVGTIRALTSADGELMNSKYATAIISNDQVVVTATVPPTFSFSLSGNTDSFTAPLTNASVVSTTGRTVTISTNAASGWVAWIKSANAALNSLSTGGTIATFGTVNDTPDSISFASGNTGYVMDVNLATTAGNCTIAQNVGYGDEYAGADTDSGGTLSTTFQPVAECTGGASDNENFTMVERARIVTTQAAATDYTDTLTVVGAGRF